VSISYLTGTQVKTIQQLVEREIIGVEAAINANNEMVTEYQDKPDFVSKVQTATFTLKTQLEHLKIIQETIAAPQVEVEA
jgi:hypothetical protein